MMLEPSSARHAVPVFTGTHQVFALKNKQKHYKL